MNIRRLRAGAAALTVLCAGLAFTAPSLAVEDAVPLAVDYGDLDLSTERGAETLLRRIETAAERACGLRAGHNRDIELRRQMRACAESAIEEAVSRIDAPLLTAFHQNGRSVLRRSALPEERHG
jgi:UrcA family protein